ncbi:MAG: ABC transporter permease subunit [Thermoanaerobaculia bacterium]
MAEAGRRIERGAEISIARGAEMAMERGAGFRRTAAWLVLPLVVLVFALLVYPLALLSVQSLRPGAGILDARPGSGALSLSNYRLIVSDPDYRTALLHSVVLSLGVALVATLLCLPSAWLFARREFRGKRLARALFTLPMSFSGIIVGFLTIIMLGRIGVVPQLLEKLTGHDGLSGVAYRFGGLLAAYVYFEVPRATLTLESALRKFDFRLDAAARTLGAGPWQRLRFVLVPLFLPALLSTFAVTFSVSLGSFGVALILSKRFSLLPLEIFQLYTGLLNGPLAAAMALVLGATALAVNTTMRLAFEGRVSRHA